MQNEKSDVEKFYDAAAEKLGVTRQFGELSKYEVQEICFGLNLVLNVILKEVD